jgi:hypothetical protein
LDLNGDKISIHNYWWCVNTKKGTTCCTPITLLIIQQLPEDASEIYGSEWPKQQRLQGTTRMLEEAKKRKMQLI